MSKFKYTEFEKQIECKKHSSIQNTIILFAQLAVAYHFYFCFIFLQETIKSQAAVLIGNQGVGGMPLTP